MMGAFDDTQVLEGQGRHRDISPSRRSPDGTRSTMVMEELHGERQRARRPSPRRRGETQEAMTELRDLQQNVSRPRRRSPSQGRSEGRQSVPLSMSALHHGREEVNLDAKYLRVTQAERDTDVPRLPPIPLPAWVEEDRRPNDLSGYGIPQMPLLQLDRGPSVHITPRAPEVAMPYFATPSQSVPPPPGGRGQQAMPYFSSEPAPVVQPPPVLLNQQGRTESQREVTSHKEDELTSKLIGMPLLKIVPEEKPFLGEPSFGRLLDPNLLLADDQREQQEEMLRQKPIREFYMQQVSGIYMHIALYCVCA